MELYQSIIFILIGIAICFFGYRIKRLGFFIVWFLLGYNLMLYLMPTINSLIPQIVNSGLFQTLIPIAGGILLGLLGFSIEKFCVGGIVFLLTLTVAIQYFGTAPQVLIVAAIIGALLAGLAINLIKPAIIISTAIAGAYGITTGLISLASFDKTIYFFPLLVIIAALGAIFQFTKNPGQD